MLVTRREAWAVNRNVSFMHRDIRDKSDRGRIENVYVPTRRDATRRTGNRMRVAIMQREEWGWIDH